MPNRIIKESCRTSPDLARLSHGAERFFWRLTTIADDHGRFDGAPKVLLGQCFPLLIGKVKERNIVEWLLEMEQAQLIALYCVATREYGYLRNWTKHQRSYGLASKFPDPVGHTSILPEKSIHDVLFEHLQASKTFCGHVLSGVERNVRAGSGYADLVLLTEGGRIIVELKRTRADKGSIAQVCRYRSAIKDAMTGVVIAAGLGAGFAISHASDAGVAVITYSVDGKTQLAIKNQYISACDGLLIPANACEFTNGSYPISENRDLESRFRIENRESILAQTWVSRFEEFWNAYPRKKSKGQAEKAWSKLQPNEQLQDRILDAIERAKTSADWTKDGGSYIPYPASWLNAKGWEDEHHLAIVPMQKPMGVIEKRLRQAAGQEVP